MVLITTVSITREEGQTERPASKLYMEPRGQFSENKDLYFLTQVKNMLLSGTSGENVTK